MFGSPVRQTLRRISCVLILLQHTKSCNPVTKSTLWAASPKLIVQPCENGHNLKPLLPKKKRGWGEVRKGLAGEGFLQGPSLYCFLGQ